MKIAWITLGLLAVCAAAPASAQINKWVDENGRVHYGDRPPANKPSTTVQIQKSPPMATNEAPNATTGKPSVEPPKAGAAGDPQIDAVKAKEVQKQRERLIVECKNNRGINCDSPETVKQMQNEDTPLTAEQRRSQRNEPQSDFCSRNPKIPGC